MTRTKDTWEIKHMPPEDDTRRKIKAFAVMNGFTIPQALTALINRATDAELLPRVQMDRTPVERRTGTE